MTRACVYEVNHRLYDDDMVHDPPNQRCRTGGVLRMIVFEVTLAPVPINCESLNQLTTNDTEYMRVFTITECTVTIVQNRSRKTEDE